MNKEIKLSRAERRRQKKETIRKNTKHIPKEEYLNRADRRALVKNKNLLVEIVKIINKYLPQLSYIIDNLTDKRKKSYIKYNMRTIIFTRLFALICGITTMNGMTRTFNTENTIKNLSVICKQNFNEIPNWQTIQDVLEDLDIEEIRNIRKYIVKTLIRSKMFDKYRYNGYFQVLVDATGVTCCDYNLNGNCIEKKYKSEKTKYYKYVLEAKIVVGKIVISLDSEWIENSIIKSDKQKQDCEINAFKRLAKKIKTSYPRLKIIIGADALYASKSIMDICKENKWKYVIRFKEGRIPTLYNEFKTVVEKNNESKKENYEYVTKLDYQEEKINIIKYTENEKKTEFVYMTDLPITNKNMKATINVGRRRWKIENEGFNIQKNGTFDIGHLYSKNQTAITVHYLMIQIAHILRQLLENGLSSIKELKIKLKEISQQLKKQLISTIKNLTVHSTIQLRFDWII